MPSFPRSELMLKCPLMRAVVKGAAALQMDSAGRLRHLLTLEGIPSSLLADIFHRAKSFLADDGGIVKSRGLAGRLIFNLFFETSTRTRSAFEIAAKSLGAEVVNLDAEVLSAKNKGESLFDTAATLSAMGGDMLVVRHYQSGAAHFIAEGVPRRLDDSPRLAVINGGDGCHAHPTQGLLDSFTILRRRESLENLTIAIVGDILHSRVARSNAQCLRALGAKAIRAVAPKTLIPPHCESALGMIPFSNMEEGIADADVIMMLRMQRERMAGDFYPSADSYFRDYGLTARRLALAKKDALVMHPGPINRGVEIDSAVADGVQSVILPQVTHGVAVRMAILCMLSEK